MAKVIPHTCLIADDHPAIVEGLTEALVEHGIKVVGTATNGKDALKGMRRLKPDLAVLDFRMPGMDGMEVAEQARDESIRTRTIIYSAALDASLARHAHESGVWGYVGKGSKVEVLFDALDSVWTGRHYVDPAIGPEFLTGRAQITPPEMELLRLLADGLSNLEIAEAQRANAETVKSRLSRLMAKLGASSRAGAVAAAYERQLLP